MGEKKIIRADNFLNTPLSIVMVMPNLENPQSKYIKVLSEVL